MNSSVTRNRRAIVAVSLAGLIGLAAVGCAPADKDKGEDASTGATQSQAATSSDTASATPSETAEPTEAQKPVSKIENAGEGFAAGETVKSADGKGSFTQLKAVKGNPMLEDKFSDSLPSGWTQSDLAKSKQYAADVALNKLIDHPYVGHGATKENGDAYRDSLENDVDPQYSEDILSQIGDPDSTSLGGNTYYGQEGGGPDGYRYVEDGKNRIVNVEPKLIESYNEQGLGVSYKYTVRYDIRATDAAGNHYIEPHNDDIRVTVTKSAEGQFKFAGWDYDGKWLPPVQQ